MKEGFPLFVGGGDVQKDQFIGPFGGISGSKFNRIAGIAEAFEIDPLDSAAVFDVETRYDSGG
jgi:hypothetical protein